ncbi:MAG: phage head closure protein [Ancalomicrobiaceae bacterium]|nr:phage head closure protein [Ancalomicrobiaceae bacterium]
MSPPVPPPIGRLNRRIAIDALSLADDGSDVWTEIATVWGAIEPQGSEERDAGGRMLGIARWRITIRWRGDVTSGNRLRFDARSFRVVATLDAANDKRFLAIEVEEELR